GGFDEDGIESARPAHQPLDDPDEVAAHRAAHTAIVHLVNLFVGFHDQVVVDADFAEFVDNHGVAFAVVLRENAVEQRRLARTEIAGEHGNRDRCGCFAHDEPQEGEICFPYRMGPGLLHVTKRPSMHALATAVCMARRLALSSNRYKILPSRTGAASCAGKDRPHGSSVANVLGAAIVAPSWRRKAWRRLTGPPP